MSFSLETNVFSHIIFTWLSFAMKQLLEKFHFKFAFNFSFTWNEEDSCCRQNNVTVWHNITFMVNSFIFWLDIPVMINMFNEVITILLEKMLNAIDLYWFHNDILKENKSLSGNLNKLIKSCQISCQIKSSRLEWMLIWNRI